MDGGPSAESYEVLELRQQLNDTQTALRNVDGVVAHLLREVVAWKDCAQALRGSFVPDNKDHPAIKTFNSCCEAYDITNEYYKPCEP